MFPDAENMPVLGAQEAVDPLITGLVAPDLLSPELGIGLGFGPMSRATVPEAAIHKHRGLQLGKNEVRFARQPGAPSPARDAIHPKNLYQPQFSAPVAGTPDTSHYI